MARHPARRNPDRPSWVVPVLAGFGTLVVVMGVVNHVRRAKAPIYHYWADPRPTPQSVIGDEEWIPKIHQDGQTIVLELPSQMSETLALFAARTEIERRGGKPVQGRPAQ